MGVNRSNECVVCNLTFNSMKDFLKHTLSSGHQKRTRHLIMDLDEAETKGNPPLVPQTKPKMKLTVLIKLKMKLKRKLKLKLKLKGNWPRFPNLKIISTLELSSDVRMQWKI